MPKIVTDSSRVCNEFFFPLYFSVLKNSTHSEKEGQSLFSSINGKKLKTKQQQKKVFRKTCATGPLRGDRCGRKARSELVALGVGTTLGR